MDFATENTVPTYQNQDSLETDCLCQMCFQVSSCPWFLLLRKVCIHLKQLNYQVDLECARFFEQNPQTTNRILNIIKSFFSNYSLRIHALYVVCLRSLYVPSRSEQFGTRPLAILFIAAMNKQMAMLEDFHRMTPHVGNCEEQTSQRHNRNFIFELSTLQTECDNSLLILSTVLLAAGSLAAGGERGYITPSLFWGKARVILQHTLR